jgi:hypothetical protein
MSPFDLNTGRSGRVGFASASHSPDVKLIRPDTPIYLPPPMHTPATREHTERAKALIVLALTLACTAMSILDLVLLASNS